MGWIFAALLVGIVLSTARFATPAQKERNRLQVDIFGFWSWLVLAPLVTWMAFDAGGWPLGLAVLGSLGLLLIHLRRKIRAAKADPLKDAE